jgi:hypothetical protein
LLPVDLADADDVPELKDPPAVKPGLQVNELAKKLGRYSKRDGDRKVIRTAHKHRAHDGLSFGNDQIPAVVAIPENKEPLNNMEIPAIVELRDNNPILYPLLVLSLQDTRFHIAQQLGLSRGQLRQETKGEGHCFVQRLHSHQEYYQIQGGTWETVFL